MTNKVEKLIYDMSLRIRLYRVSKGQGEGPAGLSERETLLIELIGLKGSMSISELVKLYSRVSPSTISTTITRLWRDKKLVYKATHPTNQRLTIVSLTDVGKKVLTQIIADRSRIYRKVAQSLGVLSEQNGSFQLFLENGIEFFNQKLGLENDHLPS